MGMKRGEIQRKFDEIVDFAGVEQFIDTPVKRYSSGMYVRLGFAVAAHLDPDILVVDEVLAVGDTAFQKKCLGKMEDVSRQGRTVLFVSHNMFNIQNFCRRGILLEEGHVVKDAAVSEVIELYLGMGNKTGGEIVWTTPESAPGDYRARLKAVRVVSEDQVSGDVRIEKDFRVEVDFWNLEKDSHRLVSIHITNGMGVTVLTSANMPSVCLEPDPWYERKYPAGVFQSSCTIPGTLLNDGVHTISVYVNVSGAFDNIIVVRDVLSFSVVDSGSMRKEYTGPWLGAVRPRLSWRTRQIE